MFSAVLIKSHAIRCCQHTLPCPFGRSWCLILLSLLKGVVVSCYWWQWKSKKRPYWWSLPEIWTGTVLSSSTWFDQLMPNFKNGLERKKLFKDQLILLCPFYFQFTFMAVRSSSFMRCQKLNNPSLLLLPQQNSWLSLCKANTQLIIHALWIYLQSYFQLLLYLVGVTTGGSSTFDLANFYIKWSPLHNNKGFVCPSKIKPGVCRLICRLNV